MDICLDTNARLFAVGHPFSFLNDGPTCGWDVVCYDDIDIIIEMVIISLTIVVLL
jgi:hypothetical protein